MKRILRATSLLFLFASACSPWLNARSDDDQRLSESEKANAFFDRVFEEAVARYPEWQTYLGIKTDYGKWNDNSDAFAKESLEITKENLRELRSTIDYEKLDAPTQVSYRMWVEDATNEIRNFKYRKHNYPVNQMFGRHTGVPSFLINMHLVESEDDALAYLSRLRGVPEVMAQLIVNLEEREQMGIVPPTFVFPRAIESCRNLLSGAPFEESEAECPILEDFRKKIAELDLQESRRKELIEEAKAALVESVGPSYRSLIGFLESQQERSSDAAGVWKFPDGAAFYDEALRLTTTTDLTAEQIHEIGLSEVERIHGAMRDIMRQVGFEGDLAAFFEFMRTDDQFYYPNTEQGKQAYLSRAVEVVDDMRSRLDELFITQPQASLIVKRVEAFREKSAGKAFYQSPAPDGSRPGIYYANLYDMRDMPKYQLEALAYHEALPGHHMQLALQQEFESLPKFRKHGGYTAYVEGWGLYCEALPKEMGLYQDPYSDFGRLAMELWRACRLVVDTGIHAKRWTREQGIDYYRANTPDTERDCIRMVERHIVMASQATAYKVGMMKLQDLRRKAKEALGDRFDIRAFHEVVLSNGAVPLTVLEELIDEYIETASGSALSGFGAPIDEYIAEKQG
ncbi:DUF885 domain-containing protein [Pelagicoccus sp. SDUM812003]|nr:DUF885 domain-containing protein [Pelagicoccus sp. SDUM812003]